MIFFVKIREDKEFDNLAKAYLADLIKKECWDNMVVKGRGIQVRFKIAICSLVDYYLKKLIDYSVPIGLGISENVWNLILCKSFENLHGDRELSLHVEQMERHPKIIDLMTISKTWC